MYTTVPSCSVCMTFICVQKWYLQFTEFCRLACAAYKFMRGCGKYVNGDTNN